VGPADRSSESPLYVGSPGTESLAGLSQGHCNRLSVVEMHLPLNEEFLKSRNTFREVRGSASKQEPEVVVNRDLF
jgi:hypothetical protein